ncbi:MAG: M48 family metalloprotease [Methanophagales archaeon]|nr:M48 family metalloprotease [Methanophagales archaeon]MCW3139615.1 M48 family metalloprotease [Methanophagales archaeon]MCW7070175.1 M48 family metalloprotease [Methanophagales archaeon]MCW7073316.1 M48 family metalloprotease [Methanophagales archaeon]
MPNAFVAGRSKRHASVVLTTGLTDLLEDEEMEAVLAYELTHINIKNSSIGIVTFSWILAGMLIALVYFAFWGAIFTGFGQKDDPAPQLLKFFVTALVTPIAATITQLTTRHHHREYQTDEQCVLLHGKPDKLACALRKIKELLKSHHFEVNPAHVHLFIVNPLHNSNRTVLDFRLPCYHFLFRTQPQPATEERVRHLLKGAGVAGAREEVEVIKTFIIIIQLYRLSPNFISNYRS